MNNRFYFRDEVAKAYILGYVKAKQEEGVLLSDVEVDDMNPEYLYTIQQKAPIEGELIRNLYEDQILRRDSHILTLQDTIEKLLKNIDEKRLSTHGDLLGK